MSQRDGVYKRKDRPGLWISWKDAQGRRRYRRTDANSLAQARSVRSAELVRVEQAKMLGFMPPGEDSFADASKRFLAYQKVRVTPKAYNREEGIVRRMLAPFFSGKLATVRKVDVQRYVTKRCGEVAPATVRKELNVIQHLLNWAVEEEIIPVNPRPSPFFV